MNNCGLFVTNPRKHYKSRLNANPAQQVSCFKDKYQKHFVELKYLSPIESHFVR